MFKAPKSHQLAYHHCFFNFLSPSYVTSCKKVHTNGFFWSVDYIKNFHLFYIFFMESGLRSWRACSFSQHVRRPLAFSCLHYLLPVVFLRDFLLTTHTHVGFVKVDYNFPQHCITVQKSHYPPAKHHAIYLWICPGHNHLLTTGADDLILSLSPKRQW